MSDVQSGGVMTLPRKALLMTSLLLIQATTDKTAVDKIGSMTRVRVTPAPKALRKALFGPQSSRLGSVRG